MGRKVGNMNSVKVTVPQNTTIVQGEFYLLDGFLGMAVQSLITGAGETADLILNIEPGEYETSQINAADAFAKGAKVYYDSENKRFTTTAAGNSFAGVVTVAKDDNDVIWFNFMPASAEVASALGTAKGFLTFIIPGQLAAGAAKIANFVFNKAVTITKIKARVKTLPGETAAMAFDVNNGEGSLFAEAPSIASTDTADAFKEFTPDADPATNSFDANDVLSIDIDNPGDTAAADLEIVIEYDQSI
jgi:hypothetical protein